MMSSMSWSHYILMTLWLLLLLLLLPSNSYAARTFLHFGICRSSEYGLGKCVNRDNCNFEPKDALDEDSKQCGVQITRERICCPNVIAPKYQSDEIVRPATLAAPKVASITLTVESPADRLPRVPHCGFELAGRIFGGNETHLLEYPWLVLLEYTTDTGETLHRCGGSFIAQRWVLTAAHCVISYFIGGGKNLTSVRLGEWDKSTDPDCFTHPSGKRDCNEKKIDVGIDRILPHKDFNINSFSNDIALLRLDRPIDWSQHRHITPICLPYDASVRDNRLSNEVVFIAGWGRTEHSRLGSDIKLKAELTVTPLQTCQPKYKTVNYTIDDTQICATGEQGVDSCQGDSGGPLMSLAYPKDGISYMYAAGIVSFGQIACGRNNFPSIYTRVGAFMDWIQDTIKNNV